MRDSLLALAERDPTSATEGILTKNNVYTWRGMMTKLLLAVYEVESAANRGGGGRAEGWEMNAMVLDVSQCGGTLLATAGVFHALVGTSTDPHRAQTGCPLP